MSTQQMHPASGLKFSCLILGLLFALGPQVWAQTIEWTKYDNTIPANADSGVASTNGRIPLGSGGNGDNAYVDAPSVIKDGSTYKMWYTGYDGVNWRIYHATSSNGLVWTKYDNTIPAASDTNSTNGKIPLGSLGTGDGLAATYPSVIKDGSTYKMWYTGNDAAGGRIYYATSSNGLAWIKYDNTTPANSDGASTNGRIPLGTAGKGDSGGAVGPCVIKDGSTYKMWYTGYGGGIYRIYYATSSNGLEWTKYDNTIPANSDVASTNGKIPLGTAGKGDSTFVFFPSVIKDGSTYKMWYAGYAMTTDRIYHATSPDGLVWTKLDNTIPPVSDTTNSNSRIGLGTAGKGDVSRVLLPSVLFFKDENGRRNYKMWYSGNVGANDRIYHATFQIPPPAGTMVTVK